MALPGRWRRYRWSVGAGMHWLVLLGVTGLLLSCSGGSGEVPPVPGPSPEAERQTIRQVLDLYSMAWVQEDIDRLQDLLQAQEADTTFQDVRTFRRMVTAAFQNSNILDLRIPPEMVHIAADRRRVTFLEIESVEDPIALVQQTRLFRTTFLLARDEVKRVITFRIGAVRREGPLVHVITRGQIQADALTRVEVHETTIPFSITGGTVEAPETSISQALMSANGFWHGLFTPPKQPYPQPLQVRLHGDNGQEIVIPHRYRLRMPDERVAHAIAETGLARFSTVALDRTGTVWAGGREPPFGGATLYQVPAGTTTARFVGDLLQNPEDQDPQGEILDLVFDELNRLHAVVFAQGVEEPPSPPDIRVVVRDQNVFCSTVNAFDPRQHYPFRVLNLRTGREEPSASTRVLAARGGTTTRGTIWLYGSDGGVARVEDGFHNGECPDTGVPVRYRPVFRRQEHRDGPQLLTNSVPALVESPDGTLWFGTALGLTVRQNKRFIPVFFNPGTRVPERAATLEAFFQAVADAIFAARPLTTVAIGDVSFVAEFGRSLVKEDLIFSMVEDSQRRVWVGTLGGGIRRIERVLIGGEQRLRDTLHLTRTAVMRVDPDDGRRTEILPAGIGSNIIFALAVGSDGAIWAATDEGVSRIQDIGETVVITNFSALDGLVFPVRDVAVGSDGIVWLATDTGLFRMTTHGGHLRGVVLGPDNQPVVGAEVIILGTPFRAVTDSEGRFVLPQLPPGQQRVLIDGALAAGGPLTQTVHEVEVLDGGMTLEPLRLAPLVGLRLLPVAGDGQRGVAGQQLQPFVVAVVDAAGNPVPDIGVTFVASSGTLRESQPVRTNAQGRAQATLILGTQAGRHEVTAQVADSNSTSLTFIATAVSGRSVAEARLVLVSGNNQSGVPGQVLPLPLVLRLIDQFGNPLFIAGVVVRATIRQGEGEIIASSQTTGGNIAEATTDARGEVRFRLRVGNNTEDIQVEFVAPDLPQAEPVQLLVIVGEVDTPDIPLDLAVAGDFVFIADRNSGLQVIDVRTRERFSLNLEGTEERLAVVANHNRAYVATSAPWRLYILDIAHPRDEDFPNRAVLGQVDFPQEMVQGQSITGVAIHDDFVYVVTAADDTGTLQVVNVRQASLPQLVHSRRLSDDIPDASPQDIAVFRGMVAYAPAGRGGILLFDLSDQTNPSLYRTVPGTFFSGLALTADAAYVLQTSDGPPGCEENCFRVFDLTEPLEPRQRGLVRTGMVSRGNVASAIAASRSVAYLVQGAFGLQAIDIRPELPTTPRLLSRVQTPTVALNVTTAGQFVYVTDQSRGLQIFQVQEDDRDGDEVFDALDAFPDDEAEVQDTDADGVGDVADPDDDNDTFLDVEETAADSPTDPTDPGSFPVTPPPPGTTTVVVDAASLSPPRERNGTEAKPYRSFTEGLRGLRALPQGALLTMNVRAGTYAPLTTHETFPLELSGLSNLTIRGAGRETTIVDTGFTGTIFNAEMPSQITITGFALLHGANGLTLFNTDSVTIIDNIVSGNIGHGIVVQDAAIRVEIAANEASNNGAQGIWFVADTREPQQPVLLHNNTLHGNRSAGIALALRAASTAVISNNMIRASGVDGIGVEGGASVEIVLNTITDNGNSGISILNTARPTIKNNTIWNNIAPGIVVEAQESSLDEVIEVIAEIDTNEVVDNESDGIRLVRGTGGAIRHNTVRGNKGIGISLSASRETVVIDNLVSGSGAGEVDSDVAGIDVEGGSSVMIQMNTIEGNAGPGIELGLTDMPTDMPILMGNIVRNNDNRGIWAENVRHAEITMNMVIHNGIPEFDKEGILLVRSAPVWLSNNTISESASAGVYLCHSAATFIDNEIRDSGRRDSEGGHGIAVVCASSADIRGGTIAGNARHGVFLSGFDFDSGLFDSPSTADIGLVGGRVSLQQNNGYGIAVNADNGDRSSARMDSDRIVFDRNTLGNCFGNVIDLAGRITCAQPE